VTGFTNRTMPVYIEYIMDAFKTGDVVRLKSGGPGMTVQKLLRNLVHCQWFVDGKKLQSGSFAPETLDAVPNYEESQVKNNPGITIIVDGAPAE
jgi:uncharacterized protein YodC (DUF2158 family)